MKAIVLVGGEGTRMRPLTETIKKELLPLVDRAILDHTLDRLVRHGVEEVVMSSPYLEATFEPFIQARRGSPVITWITEEQALDTGGAIVHALDRVGDESFFVLNGDVVTDLDLTALVEFHLDRRAVASIAVTHMDDARSYGLVVSNEDGRLREFREKPEEPVPGTINAGTYVLEPAALGSWHRGERVNIEREIFPVLIAREEPVYSFLSDAYWMDTGTPERYLQAHFDALDGRMHGLHYDAPFVAPSAIADPGAKLGRLVVAGNEVRIAARADVDRSVLLEGSVVGEGAHVTGSILGPRSSVGAGAVVLDCVLGEAASVPEGARLSGAKLAPNEVATV
jgi:NDP-sugar pyrophosphorylase family protein